MQVAMQIALLERQTLPQLQGMWQKYFDTPPISQNKEFYISRLAYRIQELAYGGLSNHQQQLIANMYIPPEERNNTAPVCTSFPSISMAAISTSLWPSLGYKPVTSIFITTFLLSVILFLLIKPEFRTIFQVFRIF